MTTSMPSRRLAAALLTLLAAAWLPVGHAQGAETLIARFDGTTATTLETLGGTEREQAFEFELPAGGYERLTLALHWNQSAATNLGLELFDAAGRRVGAAGAINALEQIVTVQAPAPGRYRAVVSEKRTVEGQSFRLVAYALAQPAEPTACQAAYAGSGAGGRAARVDPQLRVGVPGTLLLTFASDLARDSALARLQASDALGAARAQLHRYEHLPILAAPLPLVTAERVERVRGALADVALLGIYADRPLQLFLDTSTEVINAPFAREHYGLSGRGIGVAIIDSGIDTLQGDFANVAYNVKLAPFAGAIAQAPNTDTSNGHGTHVASTVGGTGAASNGRFRGVAPGATLVGLGAGDALYLTAVLEAWNHLLDPAVYLAHNVRVTNNSYGTGPGRFDPGAPINVASKRAYDKGIVSVFAAGNDGPGLDTMNAESVSPCVISVAAGKRNGTLADFSSRGVAGDDVHRPDITAPGYEIAAARASTAVVATALYPKFPDNNPGYVILNGTSMASPHVAGVVALLLESDPALDFERVVDALTATARPMADASGRPYGLHETGAGYADALAAIAWTRGEPVPGRGTGPQPGVTVIDRFAGSAGTALAAGGVSIDSSTYERRVEVPAQPELLEARVRISWPAASGNLHLVVVAPDGTSRAAPDAPVVADPAGEAVKEVVFEAPAPGAWTIRVSPRSNVGTQFSGTVSIRRPG